MSLNGMFHGMFVHWSGLRREQGTKNETLTPQDPTCLVSDNH